MSDAATPLPANEYRLDAAERQALEEIQRDLNLQVNAILRLIAKLRGLEGNWALDLAAGVLRKT